MGIIIQISSDYLLVILFCLNITKATAQFIENFDGPVP